MGPSWRSFRKSIISQKIDRSRGRANHTHARKEQEASRRRARPQPPGGALAHSHPGGGDLLHPLSTCTRIDLKLRRMDSVEVPEGIDPNSACRVYITVNSYFTIQDGRKEYNRGKTLSYVVDSEAYSIIDLEKDIASEFIWVSDQQANF
ncbi:unnamed protein product [Urochloa humidicola]